MMPWDVDRLTLPEFEGYAAAAEEYATHDTRFAKKE